ncbi:hypothetical protein BDR07DRAFT_1485020 [Suillus spraguei]|nr:hypothetical protein BDR07DRAFT_1485020 [Suillus spraguei]
MNEWTLAMNAMSKCHLDGKTYNLALLLSPAENAAGQEASKMHERFTKQVCVALLAERNKHEQERLAAAANKKGKEREVAVVAMPMEEVTSGSVEATVVPSVSAEGTPCPKPHPRVEDSLLRRAWSRYFGKCKTKLAAKTPPTAGASGSFKTGGEVLTDGLPEAVIELTEGEEMDMGEVTRQVTENSEGEDEAEFQQQLGELCVEHDLFSLADADMRKLDAQYVQRPDERHGHQHKVSSQLYGPHQEEAQ